MFHERGEDGKTAVGAGGTASAGYPAAWNSGNRERGRPGSQDHEFSRFGEADACEAGSGSKCARPASRTCRCSRQVAPVSGPGPPDRVHYWRLYREDRGSVRTLQDASTAERGADRCQCQVILRAGLSPVSYTHLTLPTIY